LNRTLGDSGRHRAFNLSARHPPRAKLSCLCNRCIGKHGTGSTMSGVTPATRNQNRGFLGRRGENSRSLARQPREGPEGEGGSQTFPFRPGNRTDHARFSCQVSGVGGQTDVHYPTPPPSGPLPGVARPGAPVECCFRAPGEKKGTSSSSLFLSCPGFPGEFRDCGGNPGPPPPPLFHR
jgi:hypothetical protein